VSHGRNLPHQSKRAASDLEAVFDYIARDSLRVASAFIDRVLKAIEGLKTFPHRNVVAGQQQSEPGALTACAILPHILSGD
jgi:plasmid stabilization system protein ParE